MDRWVIAVVANGVVTIAYLSIGAHILRGVAHSRSWRPNPLAVATGMIFLTCAAGHAGHMTHVLDPATRPYSVVIYDWHLLLIDSVTATIAIRYWLLRSRFPALVRGAAVFEDLAARRAEALDINDKIVQELATAKLALELGETPRAMQAVDRGLTAAQRVVSDILGDEARSTATVQGGGLRRTSP